MHRIRPSINKHTPVLITQRLADGLPGLRGRRTYQMIWQAFQKGSERLGGRLVHFSIQSNHLHLLVEAEDAQALARFISGLKIRLARGLNKLLGRTGKVFSDRYHSKPLRSPAETRNALAYCLNNDLRHTGRRSGPFDVYSSAVYFDGWAEGKVAWSKPVPGPPPCVAARAWLLAEGWRRAGPISLVKVPGPPP